VLLRASNRDDLDHIAIYRAHTLNMKGENAHETFSSHKCLNIQDINLSDWRSNDPSRRSAVVKVVKDSFQQVGFLLVEGHGIPTEVIDGLRNAFRDFFALPDEVKDNFAPISAHGKPGLWSGYMKKGSKAQTMLREMYSIAPSNRNLADPHSLSTTWGGPQHGFVGAVAPPCGVWPREQVPQLEPQALAYWDHMQLLVAEVLEMAGEAAGAGARWAANHTNEQGLTQLVAAYYPPQAETPAEGRIRVAPHSDASVITVVLPDEDGLQVLTRAGEWLDVPFRPEALVVNLGDMMEVCARGRWVSSKHRVVNPPEHRARTHERLSLLFFFNFNVDTVPFALLDGVCSEDESRSTRDSRLHIKDGDSAGAIRDEIAMEKVAGYENMSAGEYHFIKTAYRYQAD